MISQKNHIFQTIMYHKGTGAELLVKLQELDITKEGLVQMDHINYLQCLINKAAMSYSHSSFDPTGCIKYLLNKAKELKCLEEFLHSGKKPLFEALTQRTNINATGHKKEAIDTLIDFTAYNTNNAFQASITDTYKVTFPNANEKVLDIKTEQLNYIALQEIRHNLAIKAAEHLAPAVEAPALAPAPAPAPAPAAPRPAATRTFQEDEDNVQRYRESMDERIETLESLRPVVNAMATAIDALKAQAKAAQSHDELKQIPSGFPDAFMGAIVEQRRKQAKDEYQAAAAKALSMHTEVESAIAHVGVDKIQPELLQYYRSTIAPALEPTAEGYSPSASAAPKRPSIQDEIDAADNAILEINLFKYAEIATITNAAANIGSDLTKLSRKLLGYDITPSFSTTIYHCLKLTAGAGQAYAFYNPMLLINTVAKLINLHNPTINFLVNLSNSADVIYHTVRAYGIGGITAKASILSFLGTYIKDCTTYYKEKGYYHNELTSIMWGTFGESLEYIGDIMTITASGTTAITAFTAGAPLTALASAAIATSIATHVATKLFCEDNNYFNHLWALPPTPFQNTILVLLGIHATLPILKYAALPILKYAALIIPQHLPNIAAITCTPLSVALIALHSTLKIYSFVKDAYWNGNDIKHALCYTFEHEINVFDCLRNLFCGSSDESPSITPLPLFHKVFDDVIDGIYYTINAAYYNTVVPAYDFTTLNISNYLIPEWMSDIVGAVMHTNKIGSIVETEL